jgi:hypothetical protein
LSRHFGSGQCRQQQRRQNPNDGNDDEKFDERKRGRSRAGKQQGAVSIDPDTWPLILDLCTHGGDTLNYAAVGGAPLEFLTG